MVSEGNCHRCGSIYGDQPGNGLGISPLFCQRFGIRIEFRKWGENVDPDINSLGLVENGTRGIDPETWDPRGSICHDGREALRIAFRRKDFGGGEVVVPVSDAAIWETEPKEGAELDIYYEASNAIPVRLNSENTSNFAPYGSKVTVKVYDATNSGYLNVSLTNEDHYVDHIGYTQTHSIVGIKAKDVDATSTTVGENILQTVDIGTGTTTINSTSYPLTDQSYIVFHHPDGTQTMSKVVGFVKPVDENGNDVTPDNITETLFIESSTVTGYYKLDTDV